MITAPAMRFVAAIQRQERTRFASFRQRLQKVSRDALQEWESGEGRRDIRLRSELDRPSARADSDDEEEDGAGAGVLNYGNDRDQRRAFSGMQTFKHYQIGLDVVNAHCYELSPDQSEIILLMLQCILGQIFTVEELVRHLRYLLNFFGLDELFEDLIIQMRRRGGKTIVTCCHIALCLLVLVRGNGVCFSTSMRVSEEIHNVVKDVLITVTQKSEKFRRCHILVCNREKIIVRSIHGTNNRFQAFPCNEKIGAVSPPPPQRRTLSPVIVIIYFFFISLPPPLSLIFSLGRVRITKSMSPLPMQLVEEVDDVRSRKMSIARCF
jgi:hypothetical protein